METDNTLPSEWRLSNPPLRSSILCRPSDGTPRKWVEVSPCGQSDDGEPSQANASGDGPAGNPPTLRRHVLRKLYKWISLTETGQPFDIRVFGRNVTSLVQYGIGLPMQAIVATARLQQQALPIHYRRSATGAADSSEGVAPQQHEGIPAHTQQGLRISVFASRAKR